MHSSKGYPRIHATWGYSHVSAACVHQFQFRDGGRIYGEKAQLRRGENETHLRRAAPPIPEAMLPSLLLKRLLPGGALPRGPLAAEATATFSPSTATTDAAAGLAEDRAARGPGRAAPAAPDDVKSVLLRARARPRAPGAVETRTLPASPPSPFALMPPLLAGREGLLSAPTSLRGSDV